MSNVAIIGAGASGIISAKALLAQGFEVTIFEKTSKFSGVWNYHTKGVLYKSLKTNLPKEIMVFEDEKITYKSDRSFVDYNNVRDYLVDNAKAWGIDKYVHLNCEVVSLEPLESTTNKPLWKLAYIKNNEKIYKKFQFVIICNGHYNVTKIPTAIQGVNMVKDYISHSKSYRSPDNHGKKILCVGYSSSGMDISHELLNSGREVYVSLQDLDRDEEAFNLKNIKKEIKFISSPKIIERSKIGCIVKTQHNNSLEIDEIIFCTGYDYKFPFLSQDIISTDNNIVEPLYNQLLHEKYINLAFVGLPWKTLPFLLSECQAIFLAELWQPNNDSLASIILKLKDSKSHKASFKNSSLKYYHMLGDQQWAYNLGLLELVGQKTKSRTQRIKSIQQIYNNVHELKKSLPFTFRDFSYKADLDKGEWLRVYGLE